eukprot:m.113887 g.113887  ORF g.113887 m.113887 type:complete len:56 (-) comp51882_c0_seq2:2222-2389(-)
MASCVCMFAEGRVIQGGYMFLIFPCILTSMLIVVLAVLLNNIFTNRRYPTYWKFY